MIAHRHLSTLPARGVTWLWAALRAKEGRVSLPSAKPPQRWGEAQGFPTRSKPPSFTLSTPRSVAPADGTPAHELLQLSGGRLPTSLWLDVPAAPNCLHAIHCMAAADVLLRSNQADHTAELAGFVSRGHALRYDHTDPNRMTAEQLASLIRGGAPVLGSQ